MLDKVSDPQITFYLRDEDSRYKGEGKAGPDDYSLTSLANGEGLFIFSGRNQSLYLSDEQVRDLHEYLSTVYLAKEDIG